MNQERIDMQDLIRVGFHDPAGRKGKTGDIKYARARAAWIVVGADALGRVFVLDAVAGKYDATTMQTMTLDICEKWNPIVFGVEANAMQAIYADLTLQRARTENRRIPLQSVYQPTNVDKDFRIRQILKTTSSSGRLFIPPKFVELRQELMAFPSSPRKDMIDALASAIRLLPTPTPTVAIESELADRLAWLRERGADPRHIEAVSRGLA